jgi:hypothetical protein
MARNTALAAVACALCGSVAGGAANQPATQGPAFVRITPEEVRWQEIPGGFGAQVATISGDPSGRGLYVQRVRFPPHVMDRPHWHPNDRYVTVLKGTWFAGTGGTFDPAHAVPLKPGSYMFHPAKGLHWDGSGGDEEVIVQIFGIGPADTVSADPKRPLWVQLRSGGQQ